MNNQIDLLFDSTDITKIIARCVNDFELLKLLSESDKVAAINAIRMSLAKHSPFSAEPVDCVQWVPAALVTANDYNPNTVAPPEMRLLEHSITEDGYTQPIVSWHHDGVYEVVDGFHRHRVGRESAVVGARVKGYLPLVVINSERQDKNDRIASTIRHNRARGKHRVEAMSDIVIELKRRNWSDDRISRELGMDADEVLRLCQITGLSDVFKDQRFSEAWEAEKTTASVEGEIFTDIIDGYESNDKGRVFHPWEKWECYQAGFYADRPPAGMTMEQGEEAYREFLSDLDQFAAALEYITANWICSCEHYLTNDRMNRIAWLGQASVAYALGLPSLCRAGYHRLTENQQAAADNCALEYLNRWLERSGRPQVSLQDAIGRTEMELY
jgi:ParB-like chromosome segregation protein Spo0J